MKIALLQIAAQDTLDGTLDKGILFCRKAKEKGADIALFPEMFSNGYRIYGRPVSDWIREAIPADHAFIQAFQSLSMELNMAIGITLLEECETGPKNTLILFDRFGSQVLKYSKVHTCDFDVERNLTPGEDFYVADLNTESGIVKVRAMICFDREFPESARLLIWIGFGITAAARFMGMLTGIPANMEFFAQRKLTSHLSGRITENKQAAAVCACCNPHSLWKA